MEKKPMEIFIEMQHFETKKEMIDYLRKLPRAGKEEKS